MIGTLPRSLRPAPSEAPNVERAAKLIKKLRLPSACCLKSKSAREWTGCPDNCTCPRSVEYEDILYALDSARAEGIAAERERIETIVHEYTDISGCAQAIAAAIRAGAKP